MHYTFNATLNRIDITTDADLFPGGRNVPHHNQKNAVMSRYKKLFDYLETELNAIALDSNLMEIEDIVKEMMVEDKPEPLDPHTCELCVGDVVWFLNYKCLIMFIDSKYHCYKYSTGEIITSTNRHDFILTQRAGVQIGESW